MTEKSTVSLNWAGLNFRIEAPPYLASRVKDEHVQFLRDNDSSAVDALIIRVCAVHGARCHGRVYSGLRVGPVLLHNEGVLIEDGTLLQNYSEKENLLIVEAQLGTSVKRKRARMLPRSLQRILNMRYATVEELEYVDFLYGIMLPSLELAMIKRGKSFLHSSAVCDNKLSGAIMFGGWGGIGKTSLSASLLLDGERFSFISDDQTLVSSDGYAFSNPWGVHLYPYNTAEFPNLRRRLWEGRGWFERCHWWLRAKIVGPSGVVRRVSPRSLYSRTCTSAKIAAAIWLERSGGVERARLEPIEAGDFAFQSAHVAMHEFRRLVKFLTGLGAVRGKIGGLTGVPDFFEQLQAVYASCLSDVPVVRVTIPQGWRADQLGSFIREHVLDRGLW